MKYGKYTIKITRPDNSICHYGYYDRKSDAEETMVSMFGALNKEGFKAEVEKRK